MGDDPHRVTSCTNSGNTGRSVPEGDYAEWAVRLADKMNLNLEE